MRTKVVFGGVSSLTSRRRLAQTVVAGLFGSALSGCGAAAEGDDSSLDEEVERADEGELGAAALAITGGTLTTSFKSSVRVRSIAGGESCTATRLQGTNKFLTAGHCIENVLATSITIFPDAEGSTPKTLTVPAGGIQVHPSFRMKTVGTTFPNSLDTYDAAVITTTTPIDAFVGPGLALPTNESPPTLPLTGTGIGYGCDTSLTTDTHEGKRQSGQFTVSTGSQNHHDLLTTGPAVGCEGDSGGPLISNVNGALIGINDAGGTGTGTFWSRTASIRNWINNPKPGNDSSLLTVSNFLFFMHNKKDGSVPRGLCMVANSNVLNTPGPVSVQLDFCSDPIGHLTGKGSGWTTFSTSPAGQFVIMNRATGLCLQPGGPAAGADLQVATCNLGAPTELQKWSFVNTASAGTFSTLRIKNRSTALCISTDSSGTNVGTKVEQATCANSSTNDSVQSWVATR
jgi:hypothetical protein